MDKFWLAILVAVLLLAGCGSAVQQSSASGPTATPQPTPITQIEPTPLIWPEVNTAPHSSIDNMPLLMGDANLQAYRDDHGILRSPIDHMPLLPGDPNVAPMPGAMPLK